MSIVLHPAYFPNIPTFAVIVRNDIIWEVHDNYQKQTYRNRCYICTDQGKHMLNIPVKHVGGDQGRQRYRDVRIDNGYRWQQQHWRTLQTAYRASPYFEFFEEDLQPLFEARYPFLLDFNLRTTAALCECLEIDMPLQETTSFELRIDGQNPDAGRCDGRFLIDAKRDLDVTPEEYTQVFGDRHGFIPRASMLDLLFNEGPQSLDYLLNHHIAVPDA